MSIEEMPESANTPNLALVEQTDGIEQIESTNRTPGWRKLVSRVAMVGLPLAGAYYGGGLASTTEHFGPLTVTVDATPNLRGETRLATVLGDQVIDQHYGYGITARIDEVGVADIISAAQENRPVATIEKQITDDQEMIVFDHLGIRLNREDYMKYKFGAELLLFAGIGAAGGSLAAEVIRNRLVDQHSRRPIIKAMGLGVLAMSLVGVGTGVARNTDGAKRTGWLAYGTENQDIIKRLDRYDERYAQTGRYILTLMDRINNRPADLPRASMCIAVFSDDHSRNIYPLAKSVVESSPCVVAMVDDGDFVDWGKQGEGEFYTQPQSVDFRSLNLGIKDIGVPYLAVKGNHDSAKTMQSLEQAGAIVLNGQPYKIQDLLITGQGDIKYGNQTDLFTPDKTDGSKDDKFLKAEDELGREMAELLKTMHPDVAFVHFPKSAEQLYGLAPLVVTGHIHEQFVEQKNTTTHVQVGSTGAEGLRNADNPDLKSAKQEWSILQFDANCQYLGTTQYSADSLGDGQITAKDYLNKNYQPDSMGDRTCVSDRIQK